MSKQKKPEIPKPPGYIEVKLWNKLISSFMSARKVWEELQARCQGDIQHLPIELQERLAGLYIETKFDDILPLMASAWQTSGGLKELYMTPPKEESNA